MTDLRDVPCGRRCAVTPHEGRATSHRQASALGDPRPQGLLSVPQRFPEPPGPTVSAAQPSQPRLGAPPVGRRAGRPVQRAPSRGRGGSPCHQRSATRGSERLPVLEGWATSTFSRAERTYRRSSAAPHFALGACLGSRAGCPASTTPLTRAGQPPRTEFMADPAAHPSRNSGRVDLSCRRRTGVAGRHPGPAPPPPRAAGRCGSARLSARRRTPAPACSAVAR